MNSGNKNILLVEDEIIIALSKKKELERYGYRVEISNTGEKAVEYCKNKFNIDLILMDIDLGNGIDGTRAAELILENHEIPIVFMSSHTEPDIVKKTELITSYGYVVKDSSITVLDASIKMAFKLFNASRKIQTSEENIRLIFNNMHDVYFKLNAKGIIEEASPSAVELYGYSSLNDILGMHANDFIFDPEENRKLKNELSKEGYIKNKILKHRKKDGSPVFLEANISLLFNNKGLPAGQVGALRDISEQRQTQKALSESREILNNVLNTIPIRVFWKNTKSLYLGCNQLFAEDSGKDNPEEIIGLNDFDIRSRDQAERNIRIDKQILKTGRAIINCEELLTDQKGDKNWINTSKFPLRNSKGKIYGILGIYEITSEQKAVKTDLIENKEKFSKAFFDHPVAMQIINIKTGQRVEMNAKCIQLFGFEDKTFLKGNIYTENITADPSGREKIVEKLLMHKKIYNAPLDIINSSGKIKNLLVSGSLLNISPGDLAIFSYIDITDTKNAEDKLLQSEERYRRLVENLSNDYFLYINNIKGIKSYVSPSATMMLGYSQEESLLHYATHLTENPINKDAVAKTEKAIKGFKQEPYLAEVFHRNGSKRILEISETPVFNSEGKVIAVEGIAHDVTKQKNIENKIKQQLLEKEIILKEVHHRIKNNFAAMESLLSIQVQGIKNVEAKKALNDAIGRLNSMQVLYEKLLISENYQTASVRNYLENLICEIIKLFSTTPDIKVVKKISDFQIDSRRLIPLGIIVNELLTNIIKYAFVPGNSGTVEIVLSNTDGNVKLVISDNGAGMPEGFKLEESKSFGLMLVKMLSTQLEGSFTINNNNGTVATVVFPSGE